MKAADYNIIQRRGSSKRDMLGMKSSHGSSIAKIDRENNDIVNVVTNERKNDNCDDSSSLESEDDLFSKDCSKCPSS